MAYNTCIAGHSFVRLQTGEGREQNSPNPPFLEVMDYVFHPDGTITLYADAVWPEKNTDCAFSNIIVIQPFEDGTFRILSNEVAETELVKKLRGQ